MSHKSAFLLALCLLGAGAANSYSQTRNFGAQTFTMDAPAGLGGNINYQFPTPPVGNPPAGFVNVGTAGQTLFWNATAGHNAWEASSIITNNTNGNGTNVTITAPLLAQSSLGVSGAMTLSALNTAGVVHTAAGTGLLSTSQVATTDIANGAVDLTSKVTGILPLANGGTGSASQNFVDLSTAQTVNGAKTFTGSTMLATNGGTAVGIGIAAPVGEMSNTPTNMLGSDGHGLSGKAFVWANSGNGYTGEFYNANVGLNSDGVAIKVADNSSSTFALDVSQGASAAVTGTPLFTVRANGVVSIPALNTVGIVHNDGAGALSTGQVNLSSGDVTGTLAIGNGGTGSNTQNFVDLTNAQTVGGNKTLTGTTTLGALTQTGTANINTTGSAVTSIGNTGDMNLTGNHIILSASTVNSVNGPTFINTNPGLGSTSIGNTTNQMSLTGAGLWSVTGAGAATFASLSSGTGSFTGAVNMNSHLINNVTTPAAASDAANKSYVDAGDATNATAITNETARAQAAESTNATNISSETTRATAAENSKLALSGGTMTGAINMNSHQINGVSAPTVGTDAANKTYVDANSGAGKLPLSGGTMTGAINMGGNAVTNASSMTATTNGGTSPSVGTVYRDAVPIAWGTINTDGSLANSFGCTFTSNYTPGFGRGASLLVANYSSYSSVVVVCSWGAPTGGIPSIAFSGWYLDGSFDGTYLNIEADNGTAFTAFPAKINFIAYGR